MSNQTLSELRETAIAIFEKAEKLNLTLEFIFYLNIGNRNELSDRDVTDPNLISFTDVRLTDPKFKDGTGTPTVVKRSFTTANLSFAVGGTTVGGEDFIEISMSHYCFKDHFNENFNQLKFKDLKSAETCPISEETLKKVFSNLDNQLCYSCSNCGQAAMVKISDFLELYFFTNEEDKTLSYSFVKECQHDLTCSSPDGFRGQAEVDYFFEQNWKFNDQGNLLREGAEIIVNLGFFLEEKKYRSLGLLPRNKDDYFYICLQSVQSTLN